MKINETIRVVTALGFPTEKEALQKAKELGEKYPSSKGWVKIHLGVKYNPKTDKWHAIATFKREESTNN